ncbi:LysR substrate-binding domain-containing protein [Roseomonas sp. NAR14]|uniref:LysR substrate-binding domain-containing protein n=1 Tax=Roseomonas acroporae TaxID=2937791 RepID=A0A9X2BVJ0_9PROT|nr:LysR substrate-binding domain-containing protein [Roseomonas acroporae]MCK8782790.1 LysR substrate-binding domain-containing protein [Roseomonas acroporae]
MASIILMTMLTVPTGLDADLLRSFVLIVESGSFTRAARQVGRTQSAISMQMRRLEELLGQKLLLRTSDGVAPTPHGIWLLDRARRVLDLSDEIVAAFHAPAVSGLVRLGSPDDYALHYLPGILGRFAETHPAVDVEVFCAPSSELIGQVRENRLDLTLMSEGQDTSGLLTRHLWRGPLVWIGSTTHHAHRRDPLPLAMAHEDCAWRRSAEAALSEAGRRWRLAYASKTQVGTYAPTIAGLAVTVGLPASLPPGLRVLRVEDGMPALPEFGIQLVRPPLAGARQAVADALARSIEEGFAAAQLREAA